MNVILLLFILTGQDSWSFAAFPAIVVITTKAVLFSWHAIVVFTSIAVIASIAVLISISSMRNTQCIELFLVMFQEYIIVSNKGPTASVIER